MFLSSGNNKHLARTKFDGASPEFNVELAADDQEEVVGLRMAMPDELISYPNDHDVIVIQGSHDPWGPQF